MAKKKYLSQSDLAIDFFNQDSYSDASDLAANSEVEEFSFYNEGGGAEESAATDAVSAVPTVNPYAAGAKVALNLFITNLQRKAQLEAGVENAKLQRAQAQRNRARVSDVYSRNMYRLNQTTRRNDLLIGIAQEEAESGVATGFAGSGLSGSSVEDINSIVMRSAAQERFTNRRNYEQQSEELNLNYKNTMEDINLNASQIGARAKENPWLDLLSAASSAGIK